jgi:proteasome lid subunit RPN8/RPN11
LTTQKEYCIHSHVLKDVLRFTCKHLGVKEAEPYLGLEVSGLLLGRSNERKVVIKSFLTGDQISEPFYTSMSDDFLASVANKITTHEISEEICGWFHSHPGVDVAFSSRDYETQINLQRLSPDAVALVVNPLKKKQFSFYRYDFSTEELCLIKMRILDDR